MIRFHEYVVRRECYHREDDEHQPKKAKRNFIEHDLSLGGVLFMNGYRRIEEIATASAS